MRKVIKSVGVKTFKNCDLRVLSAKDHIELIENEYPKHHFYHYGY
jgi:hypothetical protein